MISRYSIEEKNSYITSEEESVCPICGGRLGKYGTRGRTFIDGGGVKLTLVIRRVQCLSCKKIHHELPDILIPYKRHCANTIGKVIAGDAGDVCCEDSTIRRIGAWWAACLLYFESILTSLREKYEIIFSAHPAPKEIVRAVVNAHLWPSTRSAFLSGWRF